MVNVAGTITKVKKVANVSPKITVHAKGPQKITLSPPIYIFGSHSENIEKKSIFNPIANGINPRTVVMAVRSTGLSLV